MNQVVMAVGVAFLFLVVICYLAVAAVSWSVERHQNKQWEAQQRALKRIHEERKTMPLYHLPDPLSEEDKSVAIQAMIDELEGIFAEARTGEQESLWESW